MNGIVFAQTSAVPLSLSWVLCSVLRKITIAFYVRFFWVQSSTPIYSCTTQREPACIEFYSLACTLLRGVKESGTCMSCVVRTHQNWGDLVENHCGGGKNSDHVDSRFAAATRFMTKKTKDRFVACPPMREGTALASNLQRTTRWVENDLKYKLEGSRTPSVSSISPSTRDAQDYTKAELVRNLNI